MKVKIMVKTLIYLVFAAIVLPNSFLSIHAQTNGYRDELELKEMSTSLDNEINIVATVPLNLDGALVLQDEQTEQDDDDNGGGFGDLDDDDDDDDDDDENEDDNGDDNENGDDTGDAEDVEKSSSEQSQNYKLRKAIEHIEKFSLA